MDSKTLQINKNNIPEIFSITKNDKLYELKVGTARPIMMKLPFALDRDVAKICAMIMDGSLSKNLSSCMFSQTKDRNKVKEFGSIIENKFGAKARYFIGSNDTSCVAFSCKSLSNFFHYCLDIHKSDEDARIPKWIWYSSKEIIREYVRYAFAMEGSVGDPSKGQKGIRFHSCDKSYLVELSKLLKEKFSITSNFHQYFIKEYGNKYYLTVSNKENIIKFAKIGFALKSHQKRLTQIVNSYKNKAWEITLVSLLNLKKDKFHISGVNKLLPYLCRRAIHWRLTQLVEKGYLEVFHNYYQFANAGKDKAKSIKDSVKITALYTNPRENEKSVFNLIKARKCHISQIARELRLNTCTVRSTLKRLENKNRARLVSIDKFQRKVWIGR